MTLIRSVTLSLMSKSVFTADFTMLRAVQNPTRHDAYLTCNIKTLKLSFMMLSV
jgi:hypothetical protein